MNQMGQMNQMNQINQMNQMAQMNQMGQIPQLNPVNQMAQINPLQQSNPMLNMQSALGVQLQSQSQSQAQLQSIATPAESSSIASVVVPTFHQMQQMFQIWETMNQMGILKTTVPPKSVPIQSNSYVGKTVKDEITLPSGDKIIPLGDGKYGLIKKSNQ